MLSTANIIRTKEVVFHGISARSVEGVQLFAGLNLFPSTPGMQCILTQFTLHAPDIWWRKYEF
jgi:hypothetical protein